MGTITISYYADDWRAATLSNIAPNPMRFDDQPAVCVEGLIQAANFPEGDQRRDKLFGLYGVEVKSYMYDLVYEGGCLIYWGGNIFRRGSEEHFDLMRGMVRAKFETNLTAWDALRLSEGSRFRYKTSELDRKLSIPPDLFVQTLSETMEEIVAGSLPRPS